MRWTFQESLCALARKDERIFLLWGDVGAPMWQPFCTEFPTRQLNVGICEQSMVSMAAGMAMQGFRPVCYTITPFLIERAFEQIKIDVHLMKQPVGLVGYSEDTQGPTHVELQARILMGLVPNIHGYYPQRKESIPEIISNLNLDEPWFLALKP